MKDLRISRVFGWGGSEQEVKKVSYQASLRHPELDSGSINFYDNAIAEQVCNDENYPRPNGRG